MDTTNSEATLTKHNMDTMLEVATFGTVTARVATLQSMKYLDPEP